MSAESDSPDLQKAQTFFKYGNDAAHKGNHDYAIDMYKQCCKIVPDNLVYRQALRGIERRKFNNDPGKVGMLVGAKNQPILFRAQECPLEAEVRRGDRAVRRRVREQPVGRGGGAGGGRGCRGAGFLQRGRSGSSSRW